MTAAQNDEPGLEDLGPDALLDALADADLRERIAARDKLRIAYQWAVLHPATTETGTSTPIGASFLLTDESLGGEGCPGVAAYAAEPLAITLRISPASAQQLLADTLDLHHRLPKTWALVESLRVPAWKARQVATKTHTLPTEGAEWVDDKIAPRLKRCGARLLDTLTAQAIAEHDPPAQQTKEEQAMAGWDVTLHTPAATEYAGTSELHVTGDTLFLTDLYRQVCADAAAAGQAGDQTPLGARKSQALATLFGAGGFETGPAGLPQPPAARVPVVEEVAQRPSRNPSTPQTVLYLHLDKTDLADALVQVGRAERLGPVTETQIREWLGASNAKIQPVIRMDTDDAVDGHDPPDRTRDQVVLTYDTCQFPGCQVDSRSCDLDHVVPYDPNGPPGQTRPSNLVPLCRRHHRAKTSGLWRYTRTPQGTCLWTGPGIRQAVG